VNPPPRSEPVVCVCVCVQRLREDAYVNSQSVAGADQKAQSVAVPLYGAEDERQGRAFPAAATAAASASAAAAASARATSVDRRCTTSSSTDSKRWGIRENDGAEAGKVQEDAAEEARLGDHDERDRRR